MDKKFWLLTGGAVTSAAAGWYLYKRSKVEKIDLKYELQQIRDRIEDINSLRSVSTRYFGNQLDKIKDNFPEVDSEKIDYLSVLFEELITQIPQHSQNEIEHVLINMLDGYESVLAAQTKSEAKIANQFLAEAIEHLMEKLLLISPEATRAGQDFLEKYVKFCTRGETN